VTEQNENTFRIKEGDFYLPSKWWAVLDEVRTFYGKILS